MRWLLVLAALLATEAAAHAVLVASRPADGSALASPPSGIELQFNEPVRPIFVRLLDSAGKSVAVAAPRVDGSLIRLEVSEALDDGAYTLSYRVMSLDSHPVGGSIAFGVGAAPPAIRALPIDGPGLPRVAVRALRDLALLIAAGGVFFSVALGRFPGDSRLLFASSAVGLAASVAAFGVQVFAVGAWESTLRSPFGLSSGVAAAGLLAVAIGQPRRKALMVTGALGAVGSLALTGHALIARPAALAIAALAAHGLAVAFWVGSLAALYLVLANEPRRAAQLLRRFSPLGVAAVVVLLAAGVCLAWLQLSAPADLLGSAYGRFITAKAGLLALLLVLAATNRYRLLPALERGGPHAGRQLGRSIAAELLLVATVLVLTAVLVQTPPPARAPTHRFLSSALEAELAIAPGRAGANAVHLRLRDRQGVPIDAPEVRLEISNPDAGVEPLVRPMRRLSAGHYRHEGAEFSFPGAWEVAVQARLDDFEQIRFGARMAIR